MAVVPKVGGKKQPWAEGLSTLHRELRAPGTAHAHRTRKGGHAAHRNDRLDAAFKELDRQEDAA